MSDRGSGRLLVVAAVWIVIIAIAAVGYRFVVVPLFATRSDYDHALEAWQDVAAEARDRGMAVPALPDDPDANVLERMTDELTQALTASGQGSGAERTLRVALDSFSGYAVIRSDDFRRNLLARGLALDLVDDGADYAQRMNTIDSGETPLAVFTVDALVKASADRGEQPATIVMVIDETIGADAMVAWDTAVSAIDDLNRADARFVLTPDSPSETLARVVMANFDLGAMESQPFVRVDGAREVYERFVRASRSDPRAYVLWEPYVSKALEEPGAQVLLDSGDFRGFIVDVLVAQRSFLLDHEDDVRAFVEAYLTTLYDVGQEEASMTRLVRDDARAGGDPITEVQAASLVERIWWKNTRENLLHFGVVPNREGTDVAPLDRMIAGITSVLTRTGAIEVDPTRGSPGRLYYDRVFRALHDDAFHPGVGGTGRAESVRATAELRPLSDDEWGRLVPVGTASVDRIVFARGTARLTSRSERALEALAATLESFPHYYLEVHGHALQLGDAEANRQLADARASAARAFLLRIGVPEARIRSMAIEPSGTSGREQSVSFVLGQRPY